MDLWERGVAAIFPFERRSFFFFSINSFYLTFSRIYRAVKYSGIFSLDSEQEKRREKLTTIHDALAQVSLAMQITGMRIYVCYYLSARADDAVRPAL